MIDEAYYEVARRIAVLFRRKVLFHWAEKEERVFKKLAKAKCFEDLTTLTLVEQYYAFERAKSGDKGIHRRNLYTFLFNWHGEVDRAVLWAEKNPKLLAPKPKEKREQPPMWEQFLDATYPEAKNRDYWSAPGDVQREYQKFAQRQ